ncbi:hypothetical protein Bpfe_014366 [Biomphalaria pfeifferi]|uniref:Uncharacterized protein n=1 Tax=Biomphalaria pfeifferi TaxID=112525 RepID=A0AAD8BKG3_BIOPF|nr:hypothetical protein Bpfe_014366 [Biomphalaria pfeifferi]
MADKNHKMACSKCEISDANVLRRRLRVIENPIWPFKAKLQICLAYSCTTYQQMFDVLSGSSLNTMKMATLILTSKHSVANSANLSSYPSNYYSLLKSISYQQCTPMIYKSSLPSHYAKQCVHLSCIGSDPLYCTSMSGVWICQAKEIKFVSKVT